MIELGILRTHEGSRVELSQSSRVERRYQNKTFADHLFIYSFLTKRDTNSVVEELGSDLIY